ncbi:amiloride-sensitive sodium channel subunit gamma-like isoform X1 [Hyla sarda]|uniref:amiloride-sensitive sodium channel subunit gamma-like isoform X1 n=1 Tax=Hyla sarda TaxID=327740 RepID=UPI0024C2AF37|nr:amiloride-sensitive sodium channel subunit gamma-like isoform X1 [Hyla sarda]
MGWQQRTTLRSICSRTLGHTSAHGVPNIIHSQNRWRSCCWAAFVFLVLGCMLWQCSQLTATYLQYPTQEKVTLVNSPRLPFPAITFCNLNRARKSQLNFSRYKALNDQLSLMSNHEREYGPIGNSKERNFAFAMSQLSTQEQMALGHQLQDMLISCVFHDESCNESFFTPFLNPKLGNCYTFNGRNDSVRREDEVLNATKAGFSYGLTMELYIEQHEYLRSLSTAAGLRVVLHGQGKMPFPEDEGVNVPPGQESDIGIVKVHVKRLQEPYNSRCSSGQSIKNYYADVYGKDYSREACMKSCAQTKMIKNCGCRVWEFPAPPGLDVPLCNISEPSVNNCVVKYEYKLSHDQLKCHCPLQCDEEIFELTLSSSQWPSNTYLDAFSKRLESRRGHLDVQTIRDNVVKVVVYYQQLNYELIKEVPSMQLVDLFSSIGGLVGLWIGVSVCTVAEFLELILNILTFVIICIPNRKEECPQNPYTISDPQAKSYSPALSSDHCLLWDSVEDVSSLLRNSVKDDTTLHNPYQSCEKVNDSIYSV